MNSKEILTICRETGKCVAVFCFLLVCLRADAKQCDAVDDRCTDNRPGFSDSTTKARMSRYSEQRAGSPQPYIRNAMARAMYTKMLEDEEDRNADHSYWYMVDKKKIGGDYSTLFVQMDEDEDTKKFLDQSFEKSEWMFTQIYHQLAKTFLGWIMSSTSINGLLQRGSMFVYSEKQFQSLLGIEPSWKANSLLDLGAGDGMVTRVMAKHFHKVFATEMSTPMQWRLREKGFKILGIDEWSNGTQQYDVIACLNLLDRCDKPMTLLHDMKKALTPDTGRIIVAVVLPFKPYVEFNRDHQPEQRLHIGGGGFEEQVTHFIRDVFEPAGFTVTAFSRLPYLCEGDLEHSYYLLNDAVFVLKVAT